MDRVYEVALARLETSEPFRDKERDGERREDLCKLVLDQTGTDRIEFDTLCKRVLANMPGLGLLSGSGASLKRMGTLMLSTLGDQAG